MKNDKGSKLKLGIFVSLSITLFIAGIYLIGERQQLFSSTFHVSGIFKDISGLQIGNNVRFSGINVGTIDNINIINDSLVKVDMLIRKEVKKFIHTDCIVAIGSEGLIGDKLMVITQGSSNAPIVNDGQKLASSEPVETDAIMASIQVTAGNAEIISGELAEIMIKINNMFFGCFK